MAENNFTLTLEPDVPAATNEQTNLTVKAPSAPTDIEQTLTEKELVQVQEFSKQIDITNSNQVLMYGSAPQKSIADFSDSALESVRTKDLGAVGNMIGDLVVELKGFDVTGEEKKFLGFFKRGVNKLTALKARYDKAEVNVDKISGALEAHQIQLLKDITMLDKMYDQNLLYLRELTMYILAGKQKVSQAREEELPQLLAKANASNQPEDAQAANDYAALIDRFEKKVHDLELTRAVSIQMSPQIRLVQNNDALMAEKIQTTLMNTIPLWKSQMVLALGLSHSEQAMAAQRAVTDLTNELLEKNAATLKQSTIDTAKESERGIVDLETLQNTNKMLIETLDEVCRIQDEGREKRLAAEVELKRLEGELKNTLLTIRN